MGWRIPGLLPRPKTLETNANWEVTFNAEVERVKVTGLVPEAETLDAGRTSKTEHGQALAAPCVKKIARSPCTLPM